MNKTAYLLSVILAGVMSATSNASDKCGTMDKKFSLEVYTGGPPWSPQINLIYNNDVMEFTYSLEYGDPKDRYRKESRVEKKKVDEQERKRIIDTLKGSSWKSVGKNRHEIAAKPCWVRVSGV